METRKQRMVRYISDSRAEMQLPTLEPAFMDRAVTQWIERLRWIDDENLDECYRVSMDNHANRSPLMPKELLDAWTLIRQRPGFSAQKVEYERLCKWGCSADGWITVEAGGRVFIGLTPDEKWDTRKEYLYIKPCPDHRPAGIPRSNYAAPHCSGSWPRLRTRPGNEKPITEPRVAVAGWQSLGDVIQKLKLPEPPPEPPPLAEPEIDEDDDLGW